MSLDPSPIEPVPEETARVARAIFPKGNRYLLFRETLGTLFTDTLFADLFPTRGQPALAPWWLALAHIPQFRLTKRGDFARIQAITSRRQSDGSTLRRRALESFGDRGRSVSGNRGRGVAG